MDTIIWIFAFFGFLAFCSHGSLEKRVKKLERQLRGEEGTEEAEDIYSLQETLKQMIGEEVKISFYEDEEDSDLVAYAMTDKFVKIVDVDEKWVYVRAENKKQAQDKLIRISSIRSVEKK